MTEIIESGRLIELVIEKHSRFLEAFNSEFSEVESTLNALKQQSDAAKKEMEAAETKITVLNEKYHLIFHQAKKQREELFKEVLGRMPSKEAQELKRLESRIAEFEKKLQSSKNIEDEEKIISEIKKLLYDFESSAKKAGVIAACKVIVDRLNEANSYHRELISLQSKPKQDAPSYEKQIKEVEARHIWLKRRIESHNNAAAYWEKQKGG